MTTTKLKIIVKADDPEYERKHADNEIDSFGNHGKTAQLAKARHETHSGYDVSNKDTKGENDTVGKDFFALFA
jgi:hypothetical protein